tara:strand:- start:117 stop:290 length:174 start_codon:yes stop_codon:yes gene_type:complete
MNITSAKYIAGLDNKNTTVKATIDGQVMFVAIDAEGNRHWEAIQEWVSKGNKIAEAD